MLAMMYKDEHAHGFNVRADPLGRALAAARRAVEAAPSNHLAHHALATALFFRKEFAAFRNAAERAIALNPMDGGTTAFVGHLMAYAGDWERGCALVERARQLNPQSSRMVLVRRVLRRLPQAATTAARSSVALKINMPGYFYASAVIAAALRAARRGGSGAAVPLLQLLAMKPGFAAAAREELGKWFGPGELVEHFLDGLRKAGLEIARGKRTRQPRAPDARVLPRPTRAPRAPRKVSGSRCCRSSTRGANADLAALAEGLSEDIVTGLSRFSYLRVIARSSTSRYANEAVDVRTPARNWAPAT